MINVNICNAEGASVGTMEVDENKLGGTVHREALRQTVLTHQARSRAGTAAAKTRSEIKGSGEKPWRQKGTGRARAGSKKSPLWRGGGVTFAPKPRDPAYAVPKKVRRRAAQSALLAKLQDGEAMIADAIAVPAAKTKFIAELLTNLGIDTSCLIVTPALDRDVYLAARNIPGVSVLPASDLNAYDLVVKRQILIAKEALERMLGD